MHVSSPTCIQLFILTCEHYIINLWLQNDQTDCLPLVHADVVLKLMHRKLLESFPFNKHGDSQNNTKLITRSYMHKIVSI